MRPRRASVCLVKRLLHQQQISGELRPPRPGGLLARGVGRDAERPPGLGA
jgi:hypothetical protein